MKSSKSLRMLSIIMLVAFIVCVFNQSAGASSGPLAELYFYQHGAVGGLTSMDTTTYMSATRNNISSAGYNAYAYINVPAGPKWSASVVRTLSDDAVFFIHAHGGPGKIVCVDDYYSITRVTANISASDENYSLEYNFQNTTDKLKYVRIMYWMGCNTFNTDSSLGNLCTKSVSLGADCVIGHNSQIYKSYTNYYMYRFAYYGGTGATVATALAQAKTSTLSFFGYPSSDTGSYCAQTVNSVRITGANSIPSLVKFKPAGYGNY